MGEFLAYNGPATIFGALITPVRARWEASRVIYGLFLWMINYSLFLSISGMHIQNFSNSNSSKTINPRVGLA